MKLFHITTARLFGDFENSDLDEIVSARTITAAIKTVLRGNYFEVDDHDDKKLPHRLDYLEGVGGDVPRHTDTHGEFRFDHLDGFVEVRAWLVTEATAVEAFEFEVQRARENFLVTPRLLRLAAASAAIRSSIVNEIQLP